MKGERGSEGVTNAEAVRGSYKGEGGGPRQRSSEVNELSTMRVAQVFLSRASQVIIILSIAVGAVVNKSKAESWSFLREDK